MVKQHAVGQLVLSANVGAADWIAARLDRSVEGGIGIVVPSGFESYARVLHPASNDEEEHVRWSDVARANGYSMTPTTSWTDITPDERTLDNGEQFGLWQQPPDRGSLPAPQTSRLADLLRPYTTTPDRCWFAVWEGWAALDIPRESNIPRLRFLFDRSMFLLSGPLSAAKTSLESPPFDQRANLWWPDDHAFCVATEIDALSTYVGGSSKCVETILADDLLESFQVKTNRFLS